MNRQALDKSGERFELTIISVLKREFPDAVLKWNVWSYNLEHDATTQTDVIFILEDLVVVIEAKNWSKYIKGNYNDTEWTGRGKSTITLNVFNTIKQNSLHIRSLKNSLRDEGIEPGEFHSLIVVPDSCTVYSNCSEVVHLSNMVFQLHQFERYKNKIDTELYCNVIDEISRKEKSKYVQNLESEESEVTIGVGTNWKSRRSLANSEGK